MTFGILVEVSAQRKCRRFSLRRAEGFEEIDTTFIINPGKAPSIR